MLAERDEEALTVVFQTASTGYIGRERRAELRELLEEAGREGPLGWISTRAVEELEEDRHDSYELEVGLWPGGERRFAAALRLPRQLDQLALVITSRDNPKLKLVRKLETRRQRDKLGLFVAEGEDLVAAALEGGWELEFALVDAARAPELTVAPSRSRRSCSRRSRRSGTRRA